jgi:hypothetical protein
MALVVGTIGLAACSSSSSSSSTTTTPRSFEISTSSGQVSVSLDGKLPPGWPADTPVPKGATPAGSGSLVGQSKGVMVGVYRTNESPESVYGFYTSDPSITVSTKASAGSGSSYVGHVKMTAPVSADVTIVPYQNETLIVVVITQP